MPFNHGCATRAPPPHVLFGDLWPIRPTSPRPRALRRRGQQPAEQRGRRWRRGLGHGGGSGVGRADGGAGCSSEESVGGRKKRFWGEERCRAVLLFPFFGGGMKKKPRMSGCGWNFGRAMGRQSTKQLATTGYHGRSHFGLLEWIDLGVHQVHRARSTVATN